MIHALFVPALIGLAMPLPQTAAPPAVLTAAEVATPARATIADAGWTEGLWQGEVFGEAVEHRIMAPLGGQMPGLVRLSKDGRLDFYEFSSFLETDGGLTYRNRHFDPSLVARQDRADYVDRPLLRHDADTLYFDGITFARDGPDAMTVVFQLTDQDGGRTRHVVRYRRAGR
ncbi:DUF6265 family protein [Sphingomonas sp. RS6]